MRLIALFLLFAATSWADDHSYYDTLAAHANVDIAKAYRTQAEINADPYGGAGNTVYDATEDAAKFTLPAGNGSDDASIPLADQLRPAIGPHGVSSGSLFVFVETMHESGFVQTGDVYGLATHKAMQFEADQARGAFSTKRLEPRYRYSLVNSPYVASLDMRIYPETTGVGYTDSGFDTIGPLSTTYNIEPDKWVRMWIFLDFDNDKLYWWAGTEGAANQVLLNGVTCQYDTVFPTDNFDTFWLEWNSSSIYDNGAPSLEIWQRNLVVLEDISAATATTLVASGDFLTGSSSSSATIGAGQTATLGAGATATVQ